MTTTQRKFVLCSGECVPTEELPDHPENHIIGELKYSADEGHRVTVLALYEQSVNTNQIPDIIPLIRCELVGDARKVRCTRCNRSQRWEIGKAAIDALVAKVLKLRHQGDSTSFELQDKQFIA